MTDLERAMETLSKTEALMMNSHNQAINRLKVQISQLTNSLSEGQKGAIPRQPLTNPKNSFLIHEAQEPNQCNVVHILRSRKQVDNQVSSPLVTIQQKSNSTEASTSANPIQPLQSLKKLKKRSQLKKCISL